jgi:hypothetical protein
MSYRPFLFVATIVVTFLVMMGESKSAEYIRYTTVTGFFQQDDPATVPGTFDYVRLLTTQLCVDVETDVYHRLPTILV